jgi:hypothetical protein
MAVNVFYHRLPNGEWMGQGGNAGGPVYFKVALNSVDGLWYINFTYNGAVWFTHANGQTTPAQAQAQLDNYVANLNAGAGT